MAFTRLTSGLVAVLSTLCLSQASAATAKDYPAKPIRLIVPYAVGGSTDMVARRYADLLGRKLGQTVIIENKPGASTNIGNRIVADSTADGYTLLYGVSQITQTVSFGPFPAVDPVASLAPVSLILTSPQMIAANAQQPYTDAAGFLQAARKAPNSVSIASAQLHLYVGLFSSQAGITLLHVPYKGGAPAVTDTIGGRTDVVIGQPSVLLPFIRDGQLKAIGVMSQKRIAALPNVPSFQEAGLPGFEIVTWNGIFAPKGTPKDIINKLAAATKEALNDPSLGKLEADGIYVESSTPEQLTARVKRDMTFWKKLAADHPELATAK